MSKRFFMAWLAAAALSLAALAALANGTHAGGHEMPASHGDMPLSEHAASFGQPGDPARVARTVDVALDDDMRFHPARIDVKAGETVRFMVRNTGKVRHEMVLGPLDELKEHARQMRAQPGMAHTEPNQLRLKPGQRGSMVWRFTQPGQVDFACTEPGHLEAGMVGQVEVAR